MNPVQYQPHTVVMTTSDYQPDRSIGYPAPLGIAIGTVLAVLGVAAISLNIADIFTPNIISLFLTAAIAGVFVSSFRALLLII